MTIDSAKIAEVIELRQRQLMDRMFSAPTTEECIADLRQLRSVQRCWNEVRQFMQEWQRENK